MTKRLEIRSANHYIYAHQVLRIEVLGGIELEGLDRMRVTLKIGRNLKSNAKSQSNPNRESLPTSSGSYPAAIRYSLDLYNHTQLEKLTRTVSTKLELGASVIEASLQELTELLENHRLQEIEKRQTREEYIQPITDKDREEALEILQSPSLLQKTNKLLGESGIIGEEENRLRMYLLITSRKLEKPLHTFTLAKSGMGKTHLQETVTRLVPEEEREELTGLSENALYYFGTNELKNKLLIIEDLQGTSGTSASKTVGTQYALRELMSKRWLKKRVAFKDSRGRTKSLPIKVEGPVCVVATTTKEELYEDNANRSFLLYLDESEEQDQRIMQHQRALSANRIDLKKQKEAQHLLRNIQRVLKPIKVVNPFAEELSLPKEILKPRRTNAHYLQFIELITYYHQAQRARQYDKETGEEFIETTIEDIREANLLLKGILLRKSDVLSGASRNYLENLKSYLKKETKEEFTNREVRQVLRISRSSQSRYHLQLMENQIVYKMKGKQYHSPTYRLRDKEEYQKLENRIQDILNESVRRLENKRRSFHLPKSSQTEIETIKDQKDNDLNVSSQCPTEKPTPSYLTGRLQEIYEQIEATYPKESTFTRTDLTKLLNLTEGAVRQNLKKLQSQDLITELGMINRHITYKITPSS